MSNAIMSHMRYARCANRDIILIGDRAFRHHAPYRLREGGGEAIYYSRHMRTDGGRQESVLLAYPARTSNNKRSRARGFFFLTSLITGILIRMGYRAACILLRLLSLTLKLKADLKVGAPFFPGHTFH